MRIAALVKQIPAFEELTLGPDGRLLREGVDLEMNPYCRRAVAQAVLLAGAHPGSTVCVLTLGPPSAEDTLREAIAWGLARGVETTGVHLCDPAFAGSDTLATARALAAALRREGPFDLVLAGRNSVDSDTGQVGPELAELLDLPFAAGARDLEVVEAAEGPEVAERAETHEAHVRAEHDDGYARLRVTLPTLLTCAERLCEPCKVDPGERALVSAVSIRVVRAHDLGPGPWGQAASPTRVGKVKSTGAARARLRAPGTALAEQMRGVVRILAERGALDPSRDHTTVAGTVPATGRAGGPPVGVVVEPDRVRLTDELLGAAAGLAAGLGGFTVALTPTGSDPSRLGAAGADEVLELRGAEVEEDVAAGVATWAGAAHPWAILAPSTTWGREVAGRAAARLDAGLTGDAVDLEAEDGRLVAWKPAFGGQLVAAIATSSPVQLVTVRPGALPRLAPRAATATVSSLDVVARNRIAVLERSRDDDLDVLAEAAVVVCVGRGVDPAEYGALRPLLDLLDAELAATRKVTDRGWLPRARQVGLTGRSITPRLFVSIGARGAFTHTVGARGAGTILALNSSPEAEIFDAADIGIVGDWREILPLLCAELHRSGLKSQGPVGA